jgi:uroporphyrinogen-III synthase
VAKDLQSLLQGSGFEVERAALYETKAREAFSGSTAELLKQGAINGVLLYSPRTAKTFAQLMTLERYSGERHSGERQSGSDLTCFCLSENVRAALSGLKTKEKYVAAQPDQDHLLKLLEQASN